MIYPFPFDIINYIEFLNDEYLFYVNKKGYTGFINTVNEKQSYIKKLNCKKIKSITSKTNTLTFGDIFGFIDLDIRSLKSKKVIFKESVCGLKWNDHLLSTGTDDDNIIIWDDRKTFNPLYKFSDHSSSVKALSWNPKNNNILASGGGKDDKRIIIWDTSKGIKITEFLTKSQISGIEWNNEGNILVVSHGYNYYNISLYEFKNDNLYFVNTNECHNKRILTFS